MGISALSRGKVFREEAALTLSAGVPRICQPSSTRLLAHLHSQISSPKTHVFSHLPYRIANKIAAKNCCSSVLILAVRTRYLRFQCCDLNCLRFAITICDVWPKIILVVECPCLLGLCDDNLLPICHDDGWWTKAHNIAPCKVH